MKKKKKRLKKEKRKKKDGYIMNENESQKISFETSNK